MQRFGHVVERSPCETRRRRAISDCMKHTAPPFSLAMFCFSLSLSLSLHADRQADKHTNALTQPENILHPIINGIEALK